MLAAVILEVFADILFKRWSLESKNILLGVGLFFYLIGTMFWAVALKYEYLSKAVSVFTILNFILVILAGVIIFKEDLSLVNRAGIGLGIISVILMEL